MGECHIRKLQTFTSAEVLWRLDECTPHRDIISVPHSGSRHLKPVAILRNNVLAVPQRILPFEHAAVQIYAAALLKRRLAVVKYRIIYIEIFPMKRALSPVRNSCLMIFFSSFLSISFIFLLYILYYIIGLLSPRYHFWQMRI